jgi:uncharacterized protein
LTICRIGWTPCPAKNKHAAMATQFTPLASTIGGMPIGISAVMLMLFNGRSPLLYAAVMGAPFAQTVSDNVGLMTAAGLLVGFGAVYGGGCTRGHGVCGLARLSLRSLVATAIFMGTGFATVFVMRH